MIHQDPIVENELLCALWPVSIIILKKNFIDREIIIIIVVLLYLMRLKCVFNKKKKQQVVEIMKQTNKQKNSF